MANRFRNTEIWDQEWYMNLRPRMKSAVDFVRDKCDLSGVWSPNWAIANTYINAEVPVTEKELLAVDNGNQFRKLPGGKILCVDFVEFQYKQLSLSSAVHVKVIKTAQKNGIYEGIEHLIVERSETIQAKRSRLTDKTKRRIFAEDEYNCQYCGNHFSFPELCMDHIVPITKGGDNEDDNLTSACHTCNAKKWEHDVFEFIQRQNIKPLDSLSKKLNTLSKKLSSLKEKEEEEDKDKELEEVKVKDSSEATVNLSLKKNPWFSDPDAATFHDYESWIEQIRSGNDAKFEQMVMKDRFDKSLIQACTETYLALLAEYPNKKPPDQHRFRVAFLAHIREKAGTPKSILTKQKTNIDDIQLPSYE